MVNSRTATVLLWAAGGMDLVVSNLLALTCSQGWECPVWGCSPGYQERAFQA